MVVYCCGCSAPPPSMNERDLSKLQRYLHSPLHLITSTRTQPPLYFPLHGTCTCLPLGPATAGAGVEDGREGMKACTPPSAAAAETASSCSAPFIVAGLVAVVCACCVVGCVGVGCVLGGVSCWSGRASKKNTCCCCWAGAMRASDRRNRGATQTRYPNCAWLGHDGSLHNDRVVGPTDRGPGAGHDGCACGCDTCTHIDSRQSRQEPGGLPRNSQSSTCAEEAERR